MPQETESQQIKLMRRMVELAVARNRMAVTRTQMSAERSYLNAERTLSVWVRTALALMAFGIAMDRFGLLLERNPGSQTGLQPNLLSVWAGMALVVMAVLMAVTTGLRFLAYVADYRREHAVPQRHGPFLAPFFALLVAVFGVALLVLQVFFLPMPNL